MASECHNKRITSLAEWEACKEDEEEEEKGVYLMEARGGRGGSG